MIVFDDKYVPEFLKDKNKLKVDVTKDLERFEKAFNIDKERLTGLKRIPGLEKKGVKIPVYKATKFRCKSLKCGSRSGIRIILAYNWAEEEVSYIEIYSKNKRENHNEKRIIKYFKNYK